SNLTQGTYRFMLTVTDDRGGTGSDTVTIVVNPPIRTKSSATLYPNPATTTLNVKIDAATSRNYSTIRIINTMGHIVYEEEFLRTQATEIKTIDISKLEKGIYLLNLNADINTMLTMKFVKD
ncbi:MAG TPA: T9SS type A sorting domain-containing protein, partial [Flavisolibacter sp.]|nr:T9SS type A sorting domain-containing protein [Flavisolibacter sp.]